MKKSFRLLLIFVFSFATSQYEVCAQEKSRRMKKADAAFSVERYMDAVELYKKAYKKTKNRAVKAEIIFKQAECYKEAGKTKRSLSYYKRAIKAKYPAVIVHLKYADALRMVGDLEEAKIQYTAYLEKCGSSKGDVDKMASKNLDPESIEKVKNYRRGELGLRSCIFAMKWKNVPTRYELFPMAFINSRYNDFSPAFGNGEYSELYFNSSRQGGIEDKIDGSTGEYFSDVWYSKIDKKNKWSRPVAMTEPINTANNEGSVYINKRGTAMYLTQCKAEKKKSLGCAIYVSKRNGKLWGTPQLLQVKIDSNKSIVHPTLNDDESVMIFSSDLPGGYGGWDLWITVKEKRNTWSEPMNLGPSVNTLGDEFFPYLAEDGVLYFASDGHVGMGGLDVYKTSEDENGAYISPINLKSPINSSGDDFGMIVEKGGEKGYLTSNRVKWKDAKSGKQRNSKGGDDIYQFELLALKLSLKGIVTDSRNGAIVTDANVQLKGSNGLINEVKTDNTGKYSFKLEPLVSYEIIVSKKGYLNKVSRETTQGIEVSKDFIVDLSIDPVKKEIVLPLIKYDFNKFDLRPESIIDLDKLVEGLLDNPNVVIELKSHTDYIGSKSQNNRLSKKRADVCIEYLVAKGIDKGRLISKGMGEEQPFVIQYKDGRFKIGDVLTEAYIKKIRFKKNKEKANQFNRRTSFTVIREDYVPASINNK